MSSAREPNPPRTRHGSILLEVVIALAIFVTVGLAVATAMRTALTATINLNDRATANDIARSAIAQIRAGIADADALDGPVPEDEHHQQPGFNDAPQDSTWTRQIDIERSGFPNLDTVTVTVFNEARPGVTATVTALIPTNEPGLPELEAAAGAP